MTLHFEKPLIYLITKGEAAADNFGEKSREILDIVRIAVEENVPLVQLREKQLTGRNLFELTCQVVELTRGSKTKVLINDRADIAFAGGADGVHLTSTSLPVDVIRARFSTDFLIGISTHTSVEVTDAANRGADFAVFGPVFATPGKGEAVGIQSLSSVCSSSNSFPVIALGGVDESNYDSVLTAGAAGFAAIRWLNATDSLRSVAKDLNR
ncbi:MAG: thiamine phosphate synthase [Pyrinomonadaceae bacterium]